MVIRVVGEKPQRTEVGMVGGAGAYLAEQVPHGSALASGVDFAIYGGSSLVDHRADPSALRFLIGHDLKTTRERARARITQERAAEALGRSQSKINHLESGRTQQKPDEVTKLLRAYGADVESVDRMASLAGKADQGTWWAPFRDVLPNWFKIFVGLEGLAVAEFNYKALLLPGQLQTPDYAAALLEGHLQMPPIDVQPVVRARMARQWMAVEETALRFRAVIEQYVLERKIGGPKVMRRNWNMCCRSWSVTT